MVGNGGRPSGRLPHQPEVLTNEETETVAKISKELWKQIRAEWEHGATKTSLAEKYGCSAQAISNHQKNEGWHIEKDKIGEVAGVVPEPDDVVIAEPDIDAAAAQARIRELEAELAEAEAKVKEYSPTARVNIPDTPEGWIEFLGEDKITELTDDVLAAENRDRFKKGRPMLDIKDNPDLRAKEIEKIVAKREAAKTKHVVDDLRARTVKLVKPNGTIIQVIVEEQVSNEKGQPGAAIWKAKEKGFKLADPYICQAYNCWLPALVGEDGTFAYSGYCSSEHMAFDPYLGKRQIAGVTTSSTGGF